MSLDTLQRWFQSFVVEPGETPEDALKAANAQVGWQVPAEHIILPNDRLTSLQRLMIYRDQYLLRMDEALADDFGALQQLVGEDKFFRLVEEYVNQNPSRSYTLNHLGRNFPQFVAGKKASWGELARLEWAMCEVFDEEETASMDPEQAAQLAPEQWMEMRLQPIAAFRLLQLDYPVYRWLDAFRDEADFPKLRKQTSWAVVWRKNWEVWRMQLTAPQHHLLQMLGQGVPLGEAMGQVLENHRVDPALLFERFGNWVAEGMFR